MPLSAENPVRASADAAGARTAAYESAGRFLERGQDVLAAQREVQAELERAGHRVAVLDRQLEYGALATAA